MPYKDPVKRREMARHYTKRYRERNPEASKASVLRWRKANPDKYAATKARYKERHPGRVKETMRRTDQLPHRIEKRRVYWSMIDKALRRAWDKNARERRKLKINQNGGSCTLDQWLARCRLYGNCCAYCGSELGRKAEMDHIIPVSKGGTGWASNLAPACRSCNARKSASRWPTKLPRPKES